MRVVNESHEPKMTYTHECGEVIEYYLSDLMVTDKKELRCPKCEGKKAEIKLDLPNYMMVQMEHGRPILRIDVGLVLTEDALHDPQNLISAWLSFAQHVGYPLSKAKEKYLPELPERYHQNWWKKD